MNGRAGGGTWRNPEGGDGAGTVTRLEQLQQDAIVVALRTVPVQHHPQPATAKLGYLRQGREGELHLDGRGRHIAFVGGIASVLPGGDMAEAITVLACSALAGVASSALMKDINMNGFMVICPSSP